MRVEANMWAGRRRPVVRLPEHDYILSTCNLQIHEILVGAREGALGW
jgi:hypothetical protein